MPANYVITRDSFYTREAFALCGLTADLRLHQVVNPPNWTVGLMIPKSIFGERP